MLKWAKKKNPLLIWNTTVQCHRTLSWASTIQNRANVHATVIRRCV